MNVKIVTLGCKVNQYESEALLEIFEKKGFTCRSDLPADVFVLNSCTVTAESDAKTKQLFSREKRRSPSCITALVGCFPQAFPKKAELFGADILAGTKDRAALPDLVLEALERKEKISHIAEFTESELFEPLTVSGHSGHTRAFLKIQDGCSRRCAYCAIPQARGPVRSRSIDDIGREAEKLASVGFLEIVLTGINISLFGRDKSTAQSVSLCDAVFAVSKHEGVLRTRLGSLQPDVLNEHFVGELAKAEKLCPHFHLSLQSGSSGVLRRMCRPYDAEDFAQAAERLRRFFPNCSLTADIIVGFPGETEKEFAETLDLCRNQNFAKVHIFPFSPREGTPAAEMPGRLSAQEKKLRLKLLSAICNETRKSFMQMQIGKTLQVVFEQKGSGNHFKGLSETYLPVSVSAEDSSDLSGRAANVFVSAVTEDGELSGTISEMISLK